ncbi:conserved exported hypothetical protein [Rubrivivax sp. A210]|uniref:four-helix bundle copper-binding protein n=1 Tax=Rubrivivax sp. A210 TaxID=2772301 RepID=UPI001919924B|nr:four-helix bundle copper-binding protein [Rubrivivax sp. A210]CAD5374211.1 conserved exported hypothetical protein [Rubrivivax sp. A210]
MQRRHLVQAAAALAAATATAASAQVKPKAEAKPAQGMGEHAHHGAHHGSGKHAALMRSASHCLMTGEVCLQHCLVLLGEGDKSMAACAKSVNELIAICTALRSLAAQESPLLPRMAKLAMDSCLACEKECRKQDKHKECVDCGDACKECADECRKIAA